MLLTWTVYCVLLQVVYSMEIHGPHHRQCLQDSLQNQTLQLRSCDTTLDFQSWAWEDGHFLVNKGSGRCLSGKRTAGVFTTPCGHGSVLHWRCHGDRLTGLGGSVELWRDGSILLLSPRSGPPRPGSIGHRDACKAELRSGRVSRDLKDQQPGGAKRNQQGAAMGAEAQMAFLKWYYRTEDPSSWKYAMLAMSFGALLLGSVLLAISVMANRSRRKLAQYKAAALAVQMEELQDLMVTQPCTIPPKEEVPAQADAPKDTQTPHNSQTTQVRQPNGKTPIDIQNAQDSEPSQINDPSTESESLQEIEPPQESEPLRENDTPQESESIQTSEPPLESEPIQINETPEESEPTPSSDTPLESESTQIDATLQESQQSQESEPSQISEPPQESEPLQLSEPPQESEPVQISEPPQESELPQTSEPPQESELSQTSEPPQESEVPQTSEPPQESEVPQTSEPPQESEPHQINEPLPESQAEPEPLQESAQTGETTPTDAVTQETDGNVSQ